MNKQPKLNLTQSELNNLYFRWLWGSQLGWNYERMQGLGYTYTVMPVLKKLYPDPEDMRDALRMHLQFFNTEPGFGHIVVGAAVAMEAQGGKEVREAVAGIKTGLMGPFAAVGDTIMSAILATIFGALAAYMAIEGNPAGVFIWILANFGIMALRYFFFMTGYKQGSNLVTTLAAQLKIVTDSAIMLGVMVVGGLSATMVRLSTKVVFHYGDVSMSLQENLDKIMPALLPACLVGFLYWLLGRKGMNSTKAIFLVIVLGLVLSILQIS